MTNSSNETTQNRVTPNGSPILLPTPVGQQLPMQAGHPGLPEQLINPSAVLSALRRRWFIALTLGASLGLGAAYGAWMYIPSPYSTFSEIRIHSSVLHVPLRSSNREPDFKTYKQTQMKLVKSPEVLRAALRDEGVSKSETIQKLIQLKVDPARWLEKNISVRDYGTEFFRISISGEDRKDLTKIVNAVTNAYKTEIVDKEKILISKRLKLFNDLMSTAQDELDRLHQSMQQLASSEATNKEQADQRQQHLFDRRTAIYHRIAEIDSEAMNLQILKEIEEEREKDNKTQKTVIPDAVIDAHVADNVEYQELQAQVKQSSNLLDWQQRELSKNHPNLAKTKIRLKQTEESLEAFRKKMEPVVRQRLIQGLEANEKVNTSQNDFKLTLLQTNKTKLLDELNTIKIEQSDAGVSSLAIDTLGKKIGRQELYTSALANEIVRLTAEITLRDEEPRIAISRNADPPSLPDKKKKYAGTGMAGLGTFGFVVLGILFADIRMRRINSVQQVVERIGLPILGSLPTMPKAATSRKSGSWSNRARYWHGVLTESIDSARTFLLKEADRNSMKVIMIASAIGTEGKTTVACHLATSLARAGRRILLIDGDLRRPFVHQAFDIQLQSGFANILRGEITLNDAIQSSNVSGLSILTAGKTDQKALELLAQSPVEKFLEECRSQFDIIIFDSAPILPVTDSLLIAQHVDGVLFSIRRDISRSAKVSEACQRLSMLGVPLLGAVAIGLDDSIFGFRYPSRYGYGYEPYSTVASAE